MSDLAWANLVLCSFQERLLKYAKNNWPEENVKMLEEAIKRVKEGTDNERL